MEILFSKRVDDFTRLSFSNFVLMFSSLLRDSFCFCNSDIRFKKDSYV